MLSVISAFAVMMYQHGHTRETRKVSFRKDIEKAFENLQIKIEHKTHFIAKGLENLQRPEEIELLDRLSDPLPASLTYDYRLVTDTSKKKQMFVKDSELIFLFPIPDSSSLSVAFSAPLLSIEKVLGVTFSTTPHTDGQDEVLKLKDGHRLYFYNPMGNFFYSFSKKYHYESMLLIYVSLFLITFFAVGTGTAFLMGRKKTVGSLLSLIQEVTHLKEANTQLEKEMLLLKELLLYQKNRDTLRKRMRAFLEKYYYQRLKKLKELSLLLSGGIEKESLDHDESCLIAQEIKDLTGLLYERTFEPRLQDQINFSDLLERVKGHLMPTLLRANVLLSIEKSENPLFLESDEKFLELFFYAQIRTLLTKLYQDAVIKIQVQASKNSIDVTIQVNGVLLSSLTQNTDESIDLGFMKLTVHQIERLGKSLKIQINNLEDGYLICTLPIKVHNLPKREIKSGNVIKLHA